MRRSVESPPSHRNTFLSGDDADAAAQTAGTSYDDATRGAACTSRYRADFRQVGALGRGSFSSVFEARSRLDGARYAIKRSAKPLHTAAARRIALREVHALAAAGSHPNLVRYFGCVAWRCAAAAIRVWCARVQAPAMLTQLLLPLCRAQQRLV
jgi:wee1-like protein kinase